MAKFHGAIGYVRTEETSPDVYSEVITEKNYFGDVIRDVKRLEEGDRFNDNVTIANRFSVIGDSFAYDNIGAIRYIKWGGVAWKVSSVEIQRPRLILTVGGVYNLPPPPPVEPEVP